MSEARVRATRQPRVVVVQFGFHGFASWPLVLKSVTNPINARICQFYLVKFANDASVLCN